MDALRQFLYRLTALFHRGAMEADMSEEIRSHIEMDSDSVREAGGAEGRHGL
jgi:hypothetical protein